MRGETNNGRRQAVRIAFLAAVMSLVLMACGGNGGQAGDDGTDPGVATEPGAGNEGAAEAEGEGSDYPSDDITLIVPFGPGGGTDNYMRQLAPIAAEELGVNIQIRNVEGVAGLIGMRQLAEAEPDGYTIGAYNPPATNIAEMAEGEAAVSLEELTYVGSYGYGGWVMIAETDFPADTLEEVVQMYQEGEITTVGSEHVGGPTQLIAELMREQDGLAYEEYVGYEGGEIGAAVMRGEVPIGILSDSAALSAVEAGNAKVIATLYEPRSPFYPDVETSVEQGFSDISAVSRLTRVIAGPPGLPDDQVAVLADAFEAAVNDERTQEWSESTGSPVEWEGPEAAREAVDSAYGLQEVVPDLQERLGGSS